MMRKLGVSTVALLAMSGVAFAGVDVGVNVNVGTPQVRVEQRPVVIHEKETVVVKEKKDQGKHKGHYKQKGKHKK